VDEILVDARGHRCPTPTLRLRRAIENAPSGAHVRLLADDPMAKIDVPHFARQAGLTLLESGEGAGVLSFLLARP
jgi:tRNA 2-thiouridine synthesizing protein A